MGPKEQILTEVLTVLTNLKPIAERSPEKGIMGASQDINALIARAKKAYPDLPAIQQATNLGKTDTFATAVTRLSVIYGAISASLS